MPSFPRIVNWLTVSDLHLCDSKAYLPESTLETLFPSAKWILRHTISESNIKTFTNVATLVSLVKHQHWNDSSNLLKGAAIRSVLVPIRVPNLAIESHQGLC